MSGLLNLLDALPVPALAAALAEVDCEDPWGVMWRRMSAPGGGFGRGGAAGAVVVIGFGIAGRGPSAAEAARQWVLGARARVAADLA